MRRRQLVQYGLTTEREALDRRIGGSPDMDPSVGQMWAAYLKKSGTPPGTPPPTAWHFCDNQVDADRCVALVLAGRKRATTPSLWFFDSRGLPAPKVGDVDIVTNWNGIAQGVIRTTAAEIARFSDVTAEYARAEGEGDGTLESWRTTHWAYYQRELAGTTYRPAEDMPVVCQYFVLIYP